jgi:hypothetical protein
MNATRRNEKLEELHKQMASVLASKGGDYANTDVLSNFKLAGNICQITPTQQCLSLIATKVARLGVLLNGQEPNNEAVDDSVIDLINYGFLLSCLLEDEQ